MTLNECLTCKFSKVKNGYQEIKIKCSRTAINPWKSCYGYLEDKEAEQI
jgi:hypothetical protein